MLPRPIKVTDLAWIDQSWCYHYLRASPVHLVEGDQSGLDLPNIHGFEQSVVDMHGLTL